MCPLANLMPDYERFYPSSLHYSLDVYYIDICSDSHDLGRCSHRVIGRRSKVVVGNRHSGFKARDRLFFLLIGYTDCWPEHNRLYRLLAGA